MNKSIINDNNLIEILREIVENNYKNKDKILYYINFFNIDFPQNVDNLETWVTENIYRIELVLLFGTLDERYLGDIIDAIFMATLRNLHLIVEVLFSRFKDFLGDFLEIIFLLSCYSGNLNTAEWAIKNGVNPHVLDDEGYHLASLYNKINDIGHLFKQNNEKNYRKCDLFNLYETKAHFLTMRYTQLALFPCYSFYYKNKNTIGFIHDIIRNFYYYMSLTCILHVNKFFFHNINSDITCHQKANLFMIKPNGKDYWLSLYIVNYKSK